MNTKRRNIHRGELLQAAVSKSPLSITELTRRMGISRGTYYNHTQNRNLSVDLLERYGRILQHDFSQDLPSMKKYTFEEPEVNYGQPTSLKEAIEQRDYWREKYYKLLEQVSQSLLEKK